MSTIEEAQWAARNEAINWGAVKATPVERSDQELIDKYFDLDKKVEAITATISPYKKAMQAIQNEMHARLNARGAKHTSVYGGTAFKVLSLTTKTTDKAEFLRFCFGDPDWGANLLTANVAKESLKLFMERHNDQPPPGVEVGYVESVQIRRT